MIWGEPILLVRMMSVFRKSISRPSASSICPLSKIWKNISSTSGCAFSTSSSRITEYGLRRTASVSTPPSPYPTYPGGLPLRPDTLCASWYSLMLMVTSFFSPP